MHKLKSIIWMRRRFKIAITSMIMFCSVPPHSLCAASLCAASFCAFFSESSKSNSYLMFSSVSCSVSLSLYHSFFLTHIHCTLQWQIFKDQLHTRVVLVAMEIWTDKDRIPISVRPLEMLQDFSKYRQQNIKLRVDSVQLLSWVVCITMMLKIRICLCNA